MERLTKRDENGNAYYDFGFLNSNHWLRYKHIDRLAAYEDTGLSPAGIADLTARAEAAEAERDAAKADMKLIVDAVRETHCDETCCFACKFDCDTSINDSGEYGSECPGFNRDDCFEWRGQPQDGEGL